MLEIVDEGVLSGLASEGVHFPGSGKLETGTLGEITISKTMFAPIGNGLPGITTENYETGIVLLPVQNAGLTFKAELSIDGNIMTASTALKSVVLRAGARRTIDLEAKR